MPHVHFSHASTLFSSHAATLPNLARPLPRLQPLPTLASSSPNDTIPRYTVVICGAGPAGMFSTLLLTRYGIPSPHILCLDASNTRTAGHADGVNPRTQEVLDSLGLMGEITRDAGEFRERAEWTWYAPKGEGEGTDDGNENVSKEDAGGAEGIKTGAPGPGPLADKVDEEGGIKRGKLSPFTTATSRFKGGFRTFRQGKMERILEEDMLRHGGDNVVRGMKVVDVKMDEEGDREFPVVVRMEVAEIGEIRCVRCRYLIGADGAHSAVRRSLGIEMEGDTSDDTWGVIDFVPETDFPDIRRVAIVTHQDTSLLHIPREMNADRERFSRMYVLFDQGKTEEEVKNGLKADVEDSEAGKENIETAQRALRRSITLEKIIERCKETLRPYRLGVKKGTEVEWWAAYQVGQRVSQKMAVPDSRGQPRIFLMGDACHTHSPKLGQGMNVSMMDAYDLTWKLAHVLFGLTPSPRELLETYELDRKNNALNLIDMDRRWYHSRYGKYREQGRETEEWSKSMRDEILQEIVAFITGTSVEYDAGTFLIDPRRSEGSGRPGEVEGYSMGVLREGRRLADDATLTRFVDGRPVDLQTQCVSDGTYTVIIFTTKKLLKKDGRDQQTAEQLCMSLQKFQHRMVQLMVIHPLDHLSFEWTDLPPVFRNEVHNFLLRGDEAVYKKYGVDIEQGIIAVVRPDQYIGSTADLLVGAKGTEKIEKYLRKVLVPKPQSA